MPGQQHHQRHVSSVVTSPLFLTGDAADITATFRDVTRNHAADTGSALAVLQPWLRALAATDATMPVLSTDAWSAYYRGTAAATLTLLWFHDIYNSDIITSPVCEIAEYEIEQVHGEPLNFEPINPGGGPVTDAMFKDVLPHVTAAMRTGRLITDRMRGTWLFPHHTDAWDLTVDGLLATAETADSFMKSVDYH